VSCMWINACCKCNSGMCLVCA